VADQIIDLLKELGLNEKEIMIYSYLVGKDKLTAYIIAKDTGIHRSTCYGVLAKLVEKGLIISSGIKKIYYQLNDLDNAIGKIKNQEFILASIKTEINKIRLEEDTYVTHVESKNSFAEFNNKLFEMAKQKKLTFAYMIGNSPDLTTVSSKIMIKQLLKALAETSSLTDVDSKAIWNASLRNSAFMKQFKKLGPCRFLKDVPSKATTFIYDDHVAYVFLSKNDSFIEIKNKQISEEMKFYFDQLWKVSKE